MTDAHAIPDSTPLNPTDLEEARSITTPDTEHAINVAMRHREAKNDSQALLTVLSKLVLMDLRYQDADALISVLVTHVTNYAEAVAAGLIEVEDGEKQALARLLPFVLEKRPHTTLAELVFRVKRLAVADAAKLYAIDN